VGHTTVYRRTRRISANDCRCVVLSTCSKLWPTKIICGNSPPYSVDLPVDLECATPESGSSFHPYTGAPLDPTADNSTVVYHWRMSSAILFTVTILTTIGRIDNTVTQLSPPTQAMVTYIPVRRWAIWRAYSTRSSPYPSRLCLFYASATFSANV
jgi:hypothetical protein